MSTNADTAITVMIVDDHQIFSALLARALEAESDYVCVGSAATTRDAVRLAAEHRPDRVVMDIELGAESGIETTRRIRQVSPTSVVVMVTAHREPVWITRAAQAGASAYVPKDGTLVELLDVLANARDGPMLVAPSAYQGGAASAASGTSELPALTDREREILTHLGLGMNPPAIARVLHLSVHTVRGYLKTIHAKLGVNSQLEAVIRAQRIGLIEATDEA